MVMAYQMINDCLNVKQCGEEFPWLVDQVALRLMLVQKPRRSPAHVTLFPVAHRAVALPVHRAQRPSHAPSSA